MAAESQLESKIRHYAESVKVLTYKFTSPGNADVPDRLFIKNCVTLFIEIKAGGERPTAGQVEELYRINAVGGFATWVDNIVDAVEFIDLMDTSPPGELRRKIEQHNSLIF